MTEAELAAGAIDGTDVRVLADLAEMYDELDPVPDGLVERLKFELTLDALHAEVAELQRIDALAGARSDDAESQTVTFTSTSRTTMVTITPLSTDRARVDGWIAPAEALEVELRTASETLQTSADADGRFVFADVPRGHARFVLRATGGSDVADRPVVTPSVEI